MSTAGHGARQQEEAARRSVEEAERQLAAARAREQAWSAGADGEEQVAQALAGLEPLGWVVMHDVAWPGRPRANLDHVLVGPGGVLVVDTKNWSGTVTADTDRGLRSNGYRKAKEVQAVEAARQALLPLVLALSADVVAGLICLAAQDQEPIRLDGGVVGVGRAQLLQHVLDRPAVLGAQAVMETAMTLGASLRRQPVNGVPAQATPGRTPRGAAGRRAGSGRSSKRPARGGRAGAGVIRLAVIGIVSGGLVLFPEQLTRAYMSLVTAVVTPVAEDLSQDIQENMVPTTAPAPAP